MPSATGPAMLRVIVRRTAVACGAYCVTLAPVAPLCELELELDAAEFATKSVPFDSTANASGDVIPSTIVVFGCVDPGSYTVTEPVEPLELEELEVEPPALSTYSKPEPSIVSARGEAMPVVTVVAGAVLPAVNSTIELDVPEPPCEPEPDPEPELDDPEPELELLLFGPPFATVTSPLLSTSNALGAVTPAVIVAVR
jgi:hypothetical protein